MHPDGMLWKHIYVHYCTAYFVYGVSTSSFSVPKDVLRRNNMLMNTSGHAGPAVYSLSFGWVQFASP